MIGPVFDNLNDRCDGLHHREDFRRSHRHFRRPALQEGMSEGQDAVALAPGDRAGAGKIKIAAHQHAGQRLARFRVVVNVVRPGRTAPASRRDRARPDAKKISAACVPKHRKRTAASAAASSPIAAWPARAGSSRRRPGPPAIAGPRRFPRSPRRSFPPGARSGRIIGFHFEHELDGRDANQRLVLGPEKSVGVGADEFAVNEDGAAAHARHGAGELVRGIQRLADDDGSLRADEIFRNAHHLHRETVHPAAGNRRVPLAQHARL